MKIAVYCGSSAGNDEKYKNTAAELGRWMAENGHELVFGASDSGLMGAVADGVLNAGGVAIGVVPDVAEIKARMHKGLTKYVYTDTMSERKRQMIELADAFIALPGGIGTIDEITEVICLAQLRLHTKPSILYNIDGYYEPLRDMLRMTEKTGFAHPEGNGRLAFLNNLFDIGKFLSE